MRKVTNRAAVLGLAAAGLSSYAPPMAFRKPDSLLPLEQQILEALLASAEPTHGFELAQRLRDGDERRRMLAHGTLYKALDRLRTRGLLEAEWEPADAAADAGRPRRRLYRVTASGERVLASARQRDAAGGLPRAEPAT